MQFDGRRQRICRLHHRQRRQQFDRAAGVGCGRRQFRAGVEFLLLRPAQPRRRGLVYFTIQRVRPMQAIPMALSPFAATTAHWQNPPLRAAFAIGFCILFAFIGTFTFVNFVLVRPPLLLGRMDLGFVYFVFAPSVVTTLFAGRAVARFGTRPAIWAALAVAAIGLPLMLSSHLAHVLTGMVLVGVGTFFAQACATGFVGQAASDNRGIASGTYLACYFFGGMVGSVVLGQLFDRFGWTACVAGVSASLAVAAALTKQLILPSHRRSADEADKHG
jgi:MFS transporter, YNFM family, putative membrane transport protein